MKLTFQALGICQNSNQRVMLEMSALSSLHGGNNGPISICLTPNLSGQINVWSVNTVNQINYQSNSNSKILVFDKRGNLRTSKLIQSDTLNQTASFVEDMLTLN